MKIADIKNLPDKTQIPEAQGKVTAVFERKEVNGKPKQNFTLEDASGNKITVAAWEHEDLSFYKDKEVLLKAGQKGGLSVNVFNGKTSLNLSKTSTLQLVAGAAATAQPAVAPAPAQAPAPAPQSGQSVAPVQGMTVGMAINNACNNLTHMGLSLDPEKVYEIASGIIRVSRKLESGQLAPEKKDEDVPF